ncbi:Uncharacterised protein [Yersinia enterocolitica]|nr:Uncharacterised protein [Yersinia enterocolitica]CQH45593.1 Uncharacterised protein [Yersinia enterocolitica]CQH64477.1 Uncharacterised protein [Yersinia enterocolitica]CRX54379.1 Uncharacterised protein [Yersinia enterocolitica]
MFINTELDTSTLGGVALLGLGNDGHAEGTTGWHYHHSRYR